MHQNQSPILRQNVIKKPYIFAFTQKDGTEIEHEIMAESMSAAKLCAKAIAEQENLNNCAPQSPCFSYGVKERT